MKIENIMNSKGHLVVNQFIITEGDIKIFQSYNIVIAKKEKDHIFIDEKWNNSKIAQKYLCIFLNNSIEEIKKNIKDGRYILLNLND